MIATYICNSCGGRKNIDRVESAVCDFCGNETMALRDKSWWEGFGEASRHYYEEYNEDGNVTFSFGKKASKEAPKTKYKKEAKAVNPTEGWVDPMESVKAEIESAAA